MQLQLNPQLLLQLNGGTGSQNVIQNLVAISSEHFGDLMGTLHCYTKINSLFQKKCHSIGTEVEGIFK